MEAGSSPPPIAKAGKAPLRIPASEQPVHKERQIYFGQFHSLHFGREQLLLRINGWLNPILSMKPGSTAIKS